MYAADGSWNVTNVVGDVYTGLYAPDGSINIIASSPGTGYYHPCGAVRVTSSADVIVPRYHANGSLYTTTDGFLNGSQRITVIV